MGLTIRTQRGTLPTGDRAYSVVERDSGRVLVVDVKGLDALERRLWIIARDRRQPVADVEATPCPACGTPRVAFFRWCQTCGRDFEPGLEPRMPAHVSQAQAQVSVPRIEGTASASHAMSSARPAAPTATFTLAAPAKTGAAVTRTALPSPVRSETGPSPELETFELPSSSGRAPVPVMAAPSSRPPSPMPIRTERPQGTVERIPAPDPSSARNARSPTTPAVARPRTRIEQVVGDLFDRDWLDARRLAVGAFIGIAVGLVVTILLLAIE